MTIPDRETAAIDMAVIEFLGEWGAEGALHIMAVIGAYGDARQDHDKRRGDPQ